jgi:hypothetical protein
MKLAAQCRRTAVEGSRFEAALSDGSRNEPETYYVKTEET